MKIIKKIKHPNLTNAIRLTPLQLNSLKYENKQTVITPELMQEMAQNNQKLKA